VRFLSLSLPLMTHTISTLQQNIYTATHAPIVVDDVHENTISPLLLRRLVDSAQDGAVGVAATYHPDCTLSCLAFATLTRGLVVHFSPPQKANQWQKKKGQAQQPLFYRGRTLLQEHILCDPNVQLFGYRMDRIAVAVFMELSLRINAAVDILSVAAGRNSRRSFEALMNALGGEVLLRRENTKALFFHREGNDLPAMNIVALQAWAACCATTHMASRYASIPRIATDTMTVVVCGLHYAWSCILPLIHNVVSECSGKDISPC
jgi:hypothetical protein